MPLRRCRFNCYRHGAYLPFRLLSPGLSAQPLPLFALSDNLYPSSIASRRKAAWRWRWERGEGDGGVLVAGGGGQVEVGWRLE